MRALLRYRQIPFVFQKFSWGRNDNLYPHLAKQVKVQLLPVLEYNGNAFIDSSPIIVKLEKDFPNDRSVIPNSPANAFLSFLLEDFFDEWFTKVMFNGRWVQEEEHIMWSAKFILSDVHDPKDSMADYVSKRQVERTPLVGCTSTELLDDTLMRVIGALEVHLSQSDSPFFFGTRPSLAEFAMYGQSLQLIVDNHPMKIIRAHFPKAYAWIFGFDDLSGVTGEWGSPNMPPCDAVMSILRVVGDYYLPFLVANARAFEKNEKTVSLTLTNSESGQIFHHTQPRFPYQAKCLQQILKRFASLPQEVQGSLKPVLVSTNCWDVVSAGATKKSSKL